MRKSNAPAIRALLRDNPEGLTGNQIQLELPHISDKTLRRAISGMADVYIDRWVLPIRGQYQAVYCALIPPRNCPYPTNRPQMAKTEWRTIGQRMA